MMNTTAAVDRVRSRGVAYGTATHYLRDLSHAMACHYWHQIALAMSKAVDRHAGFQLAPAIRRAA